MYGFFFFYLPHALVRLRIANIWNRSWICYRVASAPISKGLALPQALLDHGIEAAGKIALLRYTHCGFSPGVLAEPPDPLTVPWAKRM